MSTLLAIDTATEQASLALTVHGRMFYRFINDVAQSHSQILLPMLQSLLAEAEIKLANCDAIAFGAGPGSFTGVRTACGIAQGLAFGLNLPVVPVIDLEAMAQAGRSVSGADRVLAVLDARMGEVYWAEYRYLNGWQVLATPRLSLPAQLQSQSAVTLCVDSAATATRLPAEFLATFANTHVAKPDARAIAELGLIYYQQGCALSAVAAQPFYLRNKVALTTLERAETMAKQSQS